MSSATPRRFPRALNVVRVGRPATLATSIAMPTAEGEHGVPNTALKTDPPHCRHGASHQKLVEMQERIRSLEGMIQPRASNDGAAPTSRVAASPGHHTTHIGQPSHRASQSQPGIPSPVVARSNSVVSASQNLHVGEQERRSVPAQEPDGGPGWSVLPT